MLLNILFIKQESLNKVLDTTVQYVHYNIQVVYGAGYSWTETNVPVYYAKIRSITVQYNIQVVYGAGYNWTETNVPVYYAKIRSITGPALDNAVEQTKVKYLKLILEWVYIFLKNRPPHSNQVRYVKIKHWVKKVLKRIKKNWILMSFFPVLFPDLQKS